MNEMGLLIGVLVLVGGTALGFFFLKLRARDESVKEREFEERLRTFDQGVRQDMHQFSQSLTQELHHLRETLDKRLNDNTERLDKRLENAGRSYVDVQKQLVEVTKMNQAILEVTKDVASLQDILKAPKIRGGFGELMLNDLLGQMLAPDHFVIQHTFKSGETVDALITLRGGSISVDSKFPLENFKRLIALPEGSERQGARRQFLSDVKKHVDAIATKYIVPSEGTIDLALMYIPAENVYYETIIKEDGDSGLYEYFNQKHVVPVSPNSFYAYLKTIMYGLQGMRIEKRAKEMFVELERLGREFGKFEADFEVLGKHIGNTHKKYEETEKRLLRLGEQFERTRLTGDGEAQVVPETTQPSSTLI
ncbi:MAG: DNA recombination protein RmuC [Candidatus Moraniibacteriota bacterium]|nr:MAG: DNA recombination protein RmuC [Candidatus Moranbacteria bacterium]